MLTDKLNELNKEQWAYYRNSYIGFENYQEAFDNSSQFIRNYFSNGGKTELLYRSITDIADNRYRNDEEKKLYEKRRQHIVTTFFLGVYIFEEIDALHFGEKTYLGKDGQYLWAWFICSLYHDLSYNRELDRGQINPPNYTYCKFASGILYSKGTLSKYYNKELNAKWCHNAKPHPDHGIVAAEQLHNSYLEKVIEILCEKNKWKEYLSGEEIILYGGYLKISLDDYFAICKIAKVIACHNVYVCSEEAQKERSTKEKYENTRLSNLMAGYPDFCYLPVVREKHGISSYNKLYFLLALVDTLEPTKRGINTAEIDINIEKVESHYEISISGGSREYLDGIKGMGTWLNFVEVSDDGHTLIIDFKNDKNKQNDDRVAEEERDAQ